MVVYELCDPQIRKCKSKEEIDKTLRFAYIFIVSNSMNYKHQENPGSDQSIQKQASYTWYALSSVVR